MRLPITQDDTMATPTSPLVPIDFPMQVCMAWIDASTGLVERWIEWQRASWQPVFDLQGRWFEYAESQMGGPASIRGAEQLA
jgi:hypothetical protein